MKTRRITNILLTVALLFALQPSLALAKDKKKSPSKPPSGKVDPTTNDPAEIALWKVATKEYSIEKVQDYVKKFPTGQHVLMAKQIIADDQIIEEIKSKGEGDRFVIPKALWPFFVAEAEGKRKDRGRTEFHELPGFDMQTKAIPVIGAYQIRMDGAGVSEPTFPCGDGSVFIISGKVGSIVGDSKEPIRLAYIASKGLIIISGKGKIIGADGKAIHETPQSVSAIQATD